MRIAVRSTSVSIVKAAERTGVGSKLLDAACALAEEHDEGGCLLVPATSKWWATS